MGYFQSSYFQSSFATVRHNFGSTGEYHNLGQAAGSHNSVLETNKHYVQLGHNFSFLAMYYAAPPAQSMSEALLRSLELEKMCDLQQRGHRWRRERHLYAGILSQGKQKDQN